MPPRKRQNVTDGDRIGPAVARTLDSLPLQPADDALAQLARIYAATIDEMSPDMRIKLLHQHAPTLIRVLEALGATPKARAAASGRKDAAATAIPTSPEAVALEEIRAARGRARRK